MTTIPANRLGTAKQFWVLLRFQARSIPKLWRLPMIISVLYFQEIMKFGIRDYRPFSSEISNYTLFLLPGLLLLTSRSLFSRSVLSTSSRSGHGWTEFEFVLTRAVDRSVVHRSTTVLFYFLIMVVPVTLLIFSFRIPDDQVWLLSRASPQDFLSHVPGSTLLPAKAGAIGPLVNVKNGNILFAAWHVWALFVGITVVQMLYLVDALRKRRWFSSVSHFAVNCLFLIIELILGVGWLGLLSNTPLFFAFSAHETTFWMFAVPGVVFGQYVCERLFSAVEQ